ncbi:MAG: NUDIX hydrolase [Candidatus Dojkabacteria bacterium]|jgi:8-oxo-dGTP diphosphatase|nr:NUDIX hydrolase [Candidatus Dojkabacteria bacterium]
MQKISCAGVIFLTSKNKVLLEDRRRIKKHGEHWSFFGGSIEKGETHKQAMKREIREEIGYDIKRYSYFKKYTFVPTNKPDLELTYHMYIAKAPDIEVLNIHKRGGIKAFTIKQALRLRITQKDKQILKDVLTYLNK